MITITAERARELAGVKPKTQAGMVTEITTEIEKSALTQATQATYQIDRQTPQEDVDWVKLKFESLGFQVAVSGKYTMSFRWS